MHVLRGYLDRPVAFGEGSVRRELELTTEMASPNRTSTERTPPPGKLTVRHNRASHPHTPKACRFRMDAVSW